jgi:hypothetical protein
MKIKTIFIGILWIFFLSGCELSSPETIGDISESTITASLIITTANTTRPTLRPLFTETPSQTPLPTLSQGELSRFLLELYETNGSCEMPCWWGIVPGETSWETALELLLPIGRIGEPLRYEKGISYRIVISTPEGFEPFSSFAFYLETQDHKIVQNVYVADTYTKSYSTYKLSDYLDLFGKPDQVYVEIHYNQEAQNKLLKPTEFIACPQYPVTWYWSIWNPESTHMDDLIDEVVDWQNEFSLEEVSGITPQEFFDIYLDPNTTVCMEGQGGTEP